MTSWIYGILGIAAIFCAYRALVTQRLLISSLYLACVSASVSALLYLLGAHQVAVIELSVGAGLVTVLMVYALSVVGDDAWDEISLLPKPLALGLVGFVIVLLGVMAFPAVEPALETQSNVLTVVLWRERVLDVWVQIALIFSGVMGVLGLLAEKADANKVKFPAAKAMEAKEVHQ
jgi:NADH:ubiquinone oxidoreductase subunit 6 (subunit J)